MNKYICSFEKIMSTWNDMLFVRAQCAHPLLEILKPSWQSSCYYVNRLNKFNYYPFDDDCCHASKSEPTPSQFSILLRWKRKKWNFFVFFNTRIDDRQLHGGDSSRFQHMDMDGILFTCFVWTLQLKKHQESRGADARLLIIQHFYCWFLHRTHNISLFLSLHCYYYYFAIFYSFSFCRNVGRLFRFSAPWKTPNENVCGLIIFSLTFGIEIDLNSIAEKKMFVYYLLRHDFKQIPKHESL